MPEEGYESFDDFVRRRSVALQRFAYLVTHDREDALDCVQDALLGLLPRWDDVVADGNVDAYVNRSIVNASVSRWRKSGRVTPVAEPVAEWGRERTPDASVLVDDADEAWRLLETLGPVQRAAVVMRYYDDLPFSEIAVALGCTEATARSHVFRALASLRGRLDRAGGEQA